MVGHQPSAISVVLFSPVSQGLGVEGGQRLEGVRGDFAIMINCPFEFHWRNANLSMCLRSEVGSATLCSTLVERGVEANAHFVKWLFKSFHLCDQVVAMPRFLNLSSKNFPFHKIIFVLIGTFGPKLI